MNNTLIQAIQKRRSIYSLGRSLSLTEAEIETLVQNVFLHIPSPFNMQSGRAVILFGEKHQTLWSTIVLNALRPHVSAEGFGATEEKIAAFAAAFGTILFFDDTTVTNGFASQFPSYAENFPVWAQQSAGMLQHSVWVALAENGIGASLQHYNPLIDDEVERVFGLPAEWKLLAQMPFGSIEQPAGEKEFLPIQQRVRVLR